MKRPKVKHAGPQEAAAIAELLQRGQHLFTLLAIVRDYEHTSQAIKELIDLELRGYARATRQYDQAVAVRVGAAREAENGDGPSTATAGVTVVPARR